MYERLTGQLPTSTELRVPVYVMLEDTRDEKRFRADLARDEQQVRAYLQKLKTIADLGNEYSVRTSEGTATLEDDLITGICLTASLSNRHQAEQVTRRLNKRYGVKVPTFAEDVGGIDLMYAKQIRKPVYGISLEQLFNEKTKITQKEPVKTYGHFLARVEEFHNPEFGEGGERTVPEHLSYSIELAYRYTPPLTTERIKTVRSLEPRLTSEIINPALEFRQTLLSAIQNAKSVFFNPGHEKFSEMVDLYELIKEKGTSGQRNIFLTQMVGLRDKFRSRESYRKLKEHIKNDKAAKFYQEILPLIEESYEGLIGDEVTIELSEEEQLSEPPPQIENAILKIKNDILRMVKQPKGKFVMSDSEAEDPESALGLYFSFDKTVKPPRVTAGVILPTPDNGTTTVYLNLDSGNNLDWNLLKTPDELPETFSALCTSVHYLLNVVAEDLRLQQQKAPEKRKKRSHFRDEIYSYRKQTDSDTGTIQNGTNGSGEYDVTPKLTIRTISLPEHVAARIADESPQLMPLITKGLERHNEGYRTLTKLQKTGPNGEKRFRLRENDHRIIIEEHPESGELYVIDILNRKDVYRRY